MKPRTACVTYLTLLFGILTIFVGYRFRSVNILVVLDRRVVLDVLFSSSLFFGLGLTCVSVFMFMFYSFVIVSRPSENGEPVFPPSFSSWICISSKMFI